MLTKILLTLVGAPGLIIGLAAAPASADTYEGGVDTPEGTFEGFCTGPGPGPGWTCQVPFTTQIFFINCFYDPVSFPQSFPNCESSLSGDAGSQRGPVS